MSKHEDTFVTDLPMEHCIVLFQRAEPSKTWEVVNFEGNRITIKERKGFAGMMISNSYPVQIELTINTDPQGTRFLVSGSNFGIGPIQSRAVRNKVEQFISEAQILIEVVKQKLMEEQLKDEIKLAANIEAGLVCPNCFQALSGGEKFCPECSTPIARKCKECGFSNVPSAKFCVECGGDLR